MKASNDGGPAFPTLGYADGMSLRAYIATQAMAALTHRLMGDHDGADGIARSAIVLADALIEELNKPQSK